MEPIRNTNIRKECDQVEAIQPYFTASANIQRLKLIVYIVYDIYSISIMIRESTIPSNIKAYAEERRGLEGRVKAQ